MADIAIDRYNHRDEYGVRPYNWNAGNENDLPITTLSTQLTGRPILSKLLSETGIWLSVCKRYAGRQLVYKSPALLYPISGMESIPMPYDFFNCMNTGSGKNLNWFWKRWFFDAGYPDLAISSVSEEIKSIWNYYFCKGNKARSG